MKQPASSPILHDQIHLNSGGVAVLEPKNKIQNSLKNQSFVYDEKLITDSFKEFFALSN